MISSTCKIALQWLDRLGVSLLRVLSFTFFVLVSYFYYSKSCSHMLKYELVFFPIF